MIEDHLSPSPPPPVIIQQEAPHTSFFRKLFFALSIVLFICVALFLLYYNGKSIYDNGI